MRDHAGVLDVTYGDGVGRTACAVHVYSLVGSDSCIGGGATLTARFPLQAVRAGVVGL